MDLDAKMWRVLSERLHGIQEANKSINEGWKVDAWAKSTPFCFDYEAYDYSDYDSTWALNIDLHDAMNEYWSEVEHDLSKLNEFAVWVVEDWGGIGGNHAATILEYCRKSQKPWKLEGAKGVSSYSKILSAKDRHRFLILDTRVAAVLNVLQLEFHEGKREYFDITGARNVAINKFNQRYKKTRFTQIGYHVSNNDIYSKYNDAVKVMAQHLDISGIEVEMMLFDNAVHIVSNQKSLDGMYQENIDFLRRRKMEINFEHEVRLGKLGII